MNGGAWLLLEGAKVDVLLRDLDVVERFAEAARRGRCAARLCCGGSHL